eukprot:1140422-Pelagomonas_calceolata.AAC.8
MSNMVTERHNIASRILLKAISKGPLGAGIASMDIGRADRLALLDLQIPEHATYRTLPKYIFPRRFPDKDRLTSSWPDAILVVPLKRVPRSNSQYLLRSAGGRRGNRENSEPTTATPPTFKAQDPSQLLPDQRHVQLVGVKYCEDTRPNSQLEASKAGLDTHKATKLARKLHAYSVQDAYKLASTDALLRRLLSTLITKIRHGGYTVPRP